jgi:hypothetical protein
MKSWDEWREEKGMKLYFADLFSSEKKRFVPTVLACAGLAGLVDRWTQTES